MKKSTKAVLLSGLVFPGVGHLYLKRWFMGVLLVGIAGAAMYYIASLTLTVALEVSEKIQSGVVSPDIDKVVALVSQQLSGTEQATNTATAIWIACWVVGVVSAYFQGRSQDRLSETQ